MSHLHWGSNYAFAAHSLKHAVVLLVLCASAAFIVALGRRASASARRAFERSAGLALVGMWLTGDAWDFINPRASASTTLPIHWCDVRGALAAFVMLAPQYRAARAIPHFWALCICTFAFALPMMKLGPAFPDFWIYFGTHGAIILTAVYDRGVRGFVPGRGDVCVAWLAAVAWTLLLQPINLALDANYGYVGANDRDVRSAIKALGAWPWRLGPMLGIELALMFAVMYAQRGVVTLIRLASLPRRHDQPIGVPSLALQSHKPQCLQRAA